MIFIPCQWGICQVLKLQLHHSGSNCFLRAASKGVPDGRSEKYQSQRWFDMSRNNKAINDRFMRVWPQSLGVWKVVPGTSTAISIKQLNIPSMSIKVNTNKPRSQESQESQKKETSWLHLFQSKSFFQRRSLGTSTFLRQGTKLVQVAGKSCLGTFWCLVIWHSHLWHVKDLKGCNRKRPEKMGFKCGKILELTKSFCIMITKSKMLKML